MKALDQSVTDNYAIYNGDCVELIQQLPDNSVDFTIYSPPFESLYVFSNSDRDMSNCSSSEEFWEHYKFLIKEHMRTTRPGRLVSVHCINLPTTIQHDGHIGIRDFRGEIIRAFEAEGFIYHSEVCIWKDPVVAMQRTKAIGLLHKQVKKDSAMSRQGIPDYLVTFRKPGENEKPVAGMFEKEKYAGSEPTKETFDLYTDEEGNLVKRNENEIKEWDSINIWQRYASPVWFDIRQGNVLQTWRDGRDSDDQKHITPLQLDVIDRALQLWSLPGDVVLTPFMGIGSEVYQSVKMGRKAIGFELKPTYYSVAKKNAEDAVASQLQGELF